MNEVALKTSTRHMRENWHRIDGDETLSALWHVYQR